MLLLKNILKYNKFVNFFEINLHQAHQHHQSNHQASQSNAGGGHNANPQPDFEKAVERSKEIAKENLEKGHEFGNRECAQRVREALEDGGVVLERTGYAKNYGPSLEKAGFEPVSSRDNKNNYEPQLGDVAVIDEAPGHKAGHMAMYDGETWYSDFKQKNMYGGGIKNFDPDYTIYRYN